MADTEQQQSSARAEKPNNDRADTASDATVLASVRFPETDLAQGIIGWDGQNDPANPQNFPPAQKWVLLGLISSITFISPLASSMASPAVDDVAKDFGVTNEILLSFSITVFLLGYTVSGPPPFFRRHQKAVQDLYADIYASQVGPLVLAPMSEIYGRRVVLNSANWFFVVWQIGCAFAPNIGALIAFRFLAGIGGVGCVTLGGGVVADLFPVQQRGLATSIWSMGPLFGPVVGPICGGFIGESIGWRWVYRILAILGGVLSLGVQLFNRETYAPVLIQRKTARMAKELGQDNLRSAYSVALDENKSVVQILMQGLRRPMVLLFRSPIIFLLATYMAFAYGLLFLFFTTITPVFRNQYGFSSGIAGLAYLGIGVGSFISLYITAITNDKIVIKLAARNGGKLEPEMRLPSMVIFACLLPISFFWYGWSADKKVHWIVPIIGTVPFGLGIIGIYMPIQAYAIDCYPGYAASVTATITAARALFGALLPLAGPKMFASLGLGWGNSLLGFLALVFVPVPILFNRYGKDI
ncbi:hypothetical protein H9Q74_007400 [Fusarium xylarioides]|nr:hypothetical protein H9Q71_009102 [Fusarium xylarioides]KAG5822502.1 hypothetical protein H9Q74_007400 [Fusarium xylarioides]